MMALNLFLYFFLLPAAPPTTLTIDFADYLTAEVNSEDCSFTANGIPFLFYDIYQRAENELICQQDETRLRAFKGLVQKADLPIKGKMVELSLASIDCSGVADLFEYDFFYENGEIIRAYGESVIIKKLHKLEYLTVTEVECGLTGIPGHAEPIVIEFNVLK